MKPVLYRYRDSESVIKHMDGYTPGEGWEPLYSQAQVDQLQAQLVFTSGLVRQVRVGEARKKGDTMTTREAFEAFISAPPFEMPIERFDDRSAWPGSYTELEVDLAWQAWQAAKATCPAWHDAPTVPGLWMCNYGDLSVATVNQPDIDTFDPAYNTGGRWYGPIPEDKP